MGVLGIFNIHPSVEFGRVDGKVIGFNLPLGFSEGWNWVSIESGFH